MKKIIVMLLAASITAGTVLSPAFPAQIAALAEDHADETGTAAQTGTDMTAAGTADQTEKKVLTDANTAVTLIDKNLTYTGKRLTPLVSVSRKGEDNKSIILTQTVDYTVDYGYADEATPAGENTLTVTGTGSYTGSVTVRYQVAKAEPRIDGSDISQDYTGSPVTLTGYTVYGADGQVDSSLKNGAEITYTGLKSGKAAPEDCGTYTATVKTKETGNYKSASRPFKITISPVNLTTKKAKVTLSSGANSVTYDGKKQEPGVTVTVPGYQNGGALVKDTDYTVSYKNNVNPGTATVTVTGKGNFTGSASKDFTIKEKDLTSISADAIGDIKAQGYTGDEVKPKPTVTVDGKKLTEGRDYELSWSDNIYPGTEAKVTVKGKGHYTGSATKNFTISSVELKADMITVSNQTYTGKALTPAVVKYKGETLRDQDHPYENEKTEDNGDSYDYNVQYINNTDAGTARVVISAGTNHIFTGSAQKEFTIFPRKLEEIYNVDDSYPYTGSEVRPEPWLYGYRTAATDDGKLTPNVDYTVSYGNNVKVGTASVTVTGRGNYTGTLTKKFQITDSYDASKVNIAGGKISDISDYTYTGSAIRPSVTVTFNGAALRSGTDYTVSYSSNTDAGSAAVIVSGKGNYRGTKSKSFTIRPASISSVSVSGLSAQKYTGSRITPSLTLTFGGKTLEERTDYTVNFTDNVDVGTADAVITGIGNFTGSVTKHFTISKDAEPTPTPTPSDARFTDVTDPDAYYYKAVNELYDEGVVAGTASSSSKKFEPKKVVTRAEFMQMLYNKALYLYKNGKSGTNPASAAATSKFSDVSSGAWYAKAVSWAVANNVTAGKTATAFAPGEEVTRAEAVQFLKNMIAPGQSYSGKTSFADVPENIWYADAVSWAVTRGVASGKSGSTFAPKEDTKRQDAAVLIDNAKNLF